MDLTVLMQLLNFFVTVPPGDENTDNAKTSGVSSDSVVTRRLTPYREFIADRESERRLTRVKQEDCRGIYGCFPTSEPWEGPERPVSLPPESLENMKPFFCLHSSKKPECWKFFPDENFDLKELSVSRNSYVIVITHGFLDSTEMPWMREMVSGLLENLEGDIHVLALDWHNGASPPYAQAVSNTRILGAVVGRLIERLVKENGLRLSHTHLVGHSLGAHLFGYTGSYVTAANAGKVGRITGLDPAGPYFRGTPPEVRLDVSDAFLVDIVHTDSTSLIPSLPVSLGYPEPLGHLDFFPNGGGEQKGCRKSPQAHILAENGVGKGVLEFFSCSHARSHRYFTTSVSKRCKYIGVECSSWKDFKEGRCWDCNKLRCFRMGFDLSRVFPQQRTPSRQPSPDEDFYGIVAGGETEVGLFMATTTNEHLCGEQLRFTLVLSDSDSARKQEGEYAKFAVVVRGQNGSAQTSPRKESVLLNPGDKLLWVDAIPSSVGQIHSVVVTFEEEDFNLLNPLIFRITPPAIYLKEILVESLLGDSKKRFKACQEKVSTGETVILKERCQPHRPFPAAGATYLM